MNKRLIAERFAKARGTYSREARVQHQVAEKMMRLVQTYAADPARPFRHVVEFGCGTGSYSDILLRTLHPDCLLLNDLCPEMKECVDALTVPRGTTLSFLPGDAEVLDFPEETDLITSCSTLQWFSEPAAFFRRCHRFLRSGGILAFTTFGPRNMHEIRALTGNGLDYLPMDEVQRLLLPHFSLLHAAQETVPLAFATPPDVLRHLQQTGVTGTEKRIWTRTRLHDFCDRYTQLFGRDDGTVTLTYQPIYIIAKKL